ncbi:MAG: hypothetical protein QXJ31_03420 [Candidatus Bathyarchaeia archaeon]
MVNRFNWVEIRVRDLEKAKNFYGSLFDWKISGGENKDWAYWRDVEDAKRQAYGRRSLHSSG